jgi:hypothetical protein
MVWVVSTTRASRRTDAALQYPSHDLRAWQHEVLIVHPAKLESGCSCHGDLTCCQVQAGVYRELVGTSRTAEDVLHYVEPLWMLPLSEIAGQLGTLQPRCPTNLQSKAPLKRCHWLLFRFERD